MQELRRLGAARAAAIAAGLVLVGAGTVLAVVGGGGEKKAKRRGDVVGLTGLHAPPSARGGAPTNPTARKKRNVSPAGLVGQGIMVGFAGPPAPASLLDAVRAGRVGSIILFSTNIQSDGQVRALNDQLKKAAREGENPPLLISVDQ